MPASTPRPPTSPNVFVCVIRAAERVASGARDSSAGCERFSLRARQDDTGELQRIVRADLRQLAVLAAAARRTQCFDSFRQRKLFADKPRHEAAAANLAARFH